MVGLRLGWRFAVGRGLSRQFSRKVGWGPYENQNIQIADSIEKELHSILRRFPTSTVEFAFGYGSGVFKQSGTQKETDQEEKPQIDLILVVNDTLQFHKENLKLNPKDYSMLKYLGLSVIYKFQNWAAGVYFNPYIEINKRQIKYGIISKELLIKDLKDWDTFYLAGRLQKPVKILISTDEILYWNQLNLMNAALVAERMITSGSSRGKSQINSKHDLELNLYKKITALSYLGDIRYTLGLENPNKVNNIVMNNIKNFEKYYQPILTKILSKKVDTSQLPSNYNVEINKCIKKLERLIRMVSVKQTLKGLFTAGIGKSIRYAWSKKMKSWTAR